MKNSFHLIFLKRSQLFWFYLFECKFCRHEYDDTCCNLYDTLNSSHFSYPRDKWNFWTLITNTGYYNRIFQSREGKEQPFTNLYLFFRRLCVWWNEIGADQATSDTWIGVKMIQGANSCLLQLVKQMCDSAYSEIDLRSYFLIRYDRQLYCFYWVASSIGNEKNNSRGFGGAGGGVSKIMRLVFGTRLESRGTQRNHGEAILRVEILGHKLGA